MPQKTIRVSSNLTLETSGKALAGKRWMELLAGIEQTQSISAAAKLVGLSYKAAWDAVEAMNNLAADPLVVRSKGGSGGGGTTLTPRGRQLVKTYAAVEAENQRFMAALNQRLGKASQDLQFFGRLSMLTSARNHFSGKVTRVKKGAVNDEVEIALAGGEKLVSVVTHESVETLGLKKGSEVIALIKASWVLVGVDSAGGDLKLSARNQLKGKVQRLTPGAVNTEVVIALKGGNSVAAIITNASAEELKLKIGKAASAIFKASSVILGVAS